MAKLTNLFFLVILTLLFLLNPILSFAQENNIVIKEQDFKTIVISIKDVLNKYINILVENGYKINNFDNINNDFDELLNNTGDITKDDLNNFFTDIKNNYKKLASMGQFSQNEDSSKMVQQLAGLSVDLDNPISILMTLISGVIAGLTGGAGVINLLFAAIIVAIDAGISIAEIAAMALIGGMLIGAIGLIIGLVIGLLFGWLIGAVIGALLLGVIAYALSATLIPLISPLLVGIPLIGPLLAPLLEGGGMVATIIIVIVAGLLGAVIGLIVGLLGGWLIGAGVGAIVGVIGGGLAGGALGLGFSAVEQIIFLPGIVFFGAIGLVLGGIGITAFNNAFTGGSKLFPKNTTDELVLVIKEIINTDDDKFVNNIGDITKRVIKHAKMFYGPKSYEMIDALEGVVNTSDLKTPEGINAATERVLQLIPAIR